MPCNDCTTSTRNVPKPARKNARTFLVSAWGCKSKIFENCHQSNRKQKLIRIFYRWVIRILRFLEIERFYNSIVNLAWTFIRKSEFQINELHKNFCYFSINCFSQSRFMLMTNHSFWQDGQYMKKNNDLIFRTNMKWILMGLARLEKENSKVWVLFWSKWRWPR